MGGGIVGEAVNGGAVLGGTTVICNSMKMQKNAFLRIQSNTIYFKVYNIPSIQYCFSCEGQ